MPSELVWVLAIGVFLWLASKATDSGKSSRSRAASGGRDDESNDDWLDERWDRIKRERDLGYIVSGPKWFFDPPTDRQISYAEELGVPGRLSKLTKGQVSDLIGLHEEPDYGDAEILKFFKEPMRRMNQTRARERVTLLMLDDANKRAYQDRPASAVQRAVLSFAGINSKGVKASEVDKLIAAKASEMSDDESDRWSDRVSSFEDVLKEFEDKQFREDNEIKKPTPAKIRAAIAQLEATGTDLADGIDAYDVVEPLLELYPDLGKD